MILRSNLSCHLSYDSINSHMRRATGECRFVILRLLASFVPSNDLSLRSPDSSYRNSLLYNFRLAVPKKLLPCFTAAQCWRHLSPPLPIAPDLIAGASTIHCLSPHSSGRPHHYIPARWLITRTKWMPRWQPASPTPSAKRMVQRVRVKKAAKRWARECVSRNGDDYNTTCAHTAHCNSYRFSSSLTSLSHRRVLAEQASGCVLVLRSDHRSPPLTSWLTS